MRHFKFALSLVTASLLIQGCDNTKKTTAVEPLPAGQQKAAEQQLQNGQIPPPPNTNPNPSPDSNPKTELSECDEFRKEIPKDWIQDYITVPEDPKNPNGTKIKVFYYGKIYPNSIPTIFFNGGPTSSSHSSVSALVGENKKIFDLDNKISFILVDQRGTGCSDFYPQKIKNMTDDQAKYLIMRLANYGSKGIVADSEAIREKLLGKDSKWNLLGQSYGAFINHRYVIEKPQSINASFSHANVIQSDGYTRIKNRVASQARVFEEYLRQFPDDKVRFENLKNLLTADTCFYQKNDKTNSVCGHEVLSVFNDILGFSTDWMSIHTWVGALVNKDKLDQKNLDHFLNIFVFSDHNPINDTRAANKVIGYIERNLAPMTTYNCTRIKADLKAEGIDLDKTYTHECISQLQVDDKSTAESSSKNILSEILPKDNMQLEDLVSTLTNYPDLKFYLYSGQKDTFVPVENFKEELDATKDLPNVHYTNFLSTGHDGFFSEPQVWKDLEQNSSK